MIYGKVVEELKTSLGYVIGDNGEKLNGNVPDTF